MSPIITHGDKNCVASSFCFYFLLLTAVCRYDMARNHWLKESCIPRKSPPASAPGFVVLNGELHVMSLLSGHDSAENRRSRPPLKKSATLFIQIYNPQKKTWRSLITNPPFSYPLDFRSAVMCTILI